MYTAETVDSSAHNVRPYIVLARDLLDLVIERRHDRHHPSLQPLSCVRLDDSLMGGKKIDQIFMIAANDEWLGPEEHVIEPLTALDHDIASLRDNWHD